MNHVYVAGSINMDVVATAARYPKMGETVPGREIFFFPGGKGANQAVSAAKLGVPTTLMAALGKMRLAGICPPSCHLKESI
jgi:ribokinase